MACTIVDDVVQDTFTIKDLEKTIRDIFSMIISSNNNRTNNNKCENT